MSSEIKITIVGGGIGGLTLAIMLQAAGINNYIVLERSSVLKATLGSTIALNACSLRLMEQLGLWPEIQKISKPIAGFNLHHDDLSPIGSIDFSFGERHYGYYGYVMARPALFEVLKSHVPKNKIALKKSVVDVIEDDSGVLCRCSDGTEVRSDILVGADGAYSNVREKMYRRLLAQNRLPAKDAEPLKVTHLSVLGVSKALDLDMFPAVREKFSKFELTLFRNSQYSIWLSPIGGNKISWCYGGEIEQGSSKDARLDTPAQVKAHWNWGPSKAQRLLDSIREHPTPYGCTVGDIISTTPKHLISSVALEEKFFETWHSKRIVLLGDACHKVLPFAGQGAVHAMLDGLCLVNLLHDLTSFTTSDFEHVFQTYHRQRSGAARKAVLGSRLFGHFIDSKGYLARWIRKVSLNLLPHWCTRTLVDLVMRDRPQLSFLPIVEDRGLCKAWC
ncbi:hypothetical protein BGZ50_008265 [Haplosporangium sp. Z 11]|nr:hypothetical protein BGZ50_008265 [Haplosporangium sp. Z 11]